MQVIYNKKTADGHLISIWEDGLVTDPQGHKIPGIGRTKLVTGMLPMFAGEVGLFDLEELWALFTAARNSRNEKITPAELRKRALDLLQHKTAKYKTLLSHFIEAAGYEYDEYGFHNSDKDDDDSSELDMVYDEADKEGLKKLIKIVKDYNLIDAANKVNITRIEYALGHDTAPDHEDVANFVKGIKKTIGQHLNILNMLDHELDQLKY